MTVETKSIIIDSFDAHLLFCEAARYALGRSTYASSATAEIIKKHIDELGDNTCYVLARDIRDSLDIYHRTHDEEEDMWYDCDIKPWEDLLPLLDKRAAN